jgi:hypothetical protein
MRCLFDVLGDIRFNLLGLNSPPLAAIDKNKPNKIPRCLRRGASFLNAPMRSSQNKYDQNPIQHKERGDAGSTGYSDSFVGKNSFWCPRVLSASSADNRWLMTHPLRPPTSTPHVSFTGEDLTTGQPSPPCRNVTLKSISSRCGPRRRRT